MDDRTALLVIVLKCVSHELGNYLSPATMLTESLLEVVGGDSAQDARDLDASLRSVTELLSMLRDVSLMFDSEESLEASCQALQALPATLSDRFPDSEALTSLAEKLGSAVERYFRTGEMRTY